MTKHISLRDLHVLLVEDSKAEALYIERTLTRPVSYSYKNCKVVKARTVAQAIATINEQDFDVVLLDLGLPDATGFSGLHAIHAAAPKMPIVILTGQSDPDLEMGAMEHGAQEYLLKDNTSPTALARTMRHAIQRKQAENMKSEFISLVSHELRTPLTAIHGSLGLIHGALAGELPPRVARLIDVAHQNSDRLIRLVNDILDIDMIDSGQVYFDIQHEPVDVIVHEAVEANQAYGDKFNVTFVVMPVTGDHCVLVDARRLTQVLTNLLSNAAKFSTAGGQVEIAVGRQGDRIRISVTDHGCGVDAAFHDRIFQKFSQSDSVTTRRVGGAGLGLYICKQMVEHMGGHIGFDSEWEQGSTFWIDLASDLAESVPELEVA